MKSQLVTFRLICTWTQGSCIMYDAPVKNVIKLDDSTDKPDGKVLVVSNEIRVRIVIAGGEGVVHIIQKIRVPRRRGEVK